MTIEDFRKLALSMREQRQFMKAYPDVFVPVKGDWGRRGCTNVLVVNADEDMVRPAMLAAWRNTAPKKVVEEKR